MDTVRRRSGDATDAYLAALRRSLHGPRRTRAGLIAETRDHLTDAIEAYERSGLTHAAAAEFAVRDFGPLQQVARGYQSVLATAAARRSAITLLTLLAPQAFLWDNGLRLAPAMATGAAHGWLMPLLDGGVEWLSTAAMAFAVAALIATGIGQRWFAPQLRLARWTGTAVALGAAGAGILGASLMALGGSAGPADWIRIIALLLVPMAWSVRTASLCLRSSEVARPASV